MRPAEAVRMDQDISNASDSCNVRRENPGGLSHPRIVHLLVVPYGVPAKFAKKCKWSAAARV